MKVHENFQTTASVPQAARDATISGSFYSPHEVRKMEILGKMTDLTVAVIVMMILPVLWAIGTQEKLIMKYAGYCGSEFAEDVCHHGGISLERYEAFINGLRAAGPGFMVEIECISEVGEPVYENGTFTGRTVSYESVCHQDEILDEMYRKGKCCFDPGSFFALTISRNERKLYVGGTVNGDP